QCGTSGERYVELHRIQEIDLCEYHDYGAPDAALPGDRWNGLAVRLDACRKLGKPMVVGEVGIRVSDAGGSASVRSNLFQHKLDAQFAAGVAGWLIWTWRDALHHGSDDYYVGPNDPALGLLKVW